MEWGLDNAFGPGSLEPAATYWGLTGQAVDLLWDEYKEWEQEHK